MFNVGGSVCLDSLLATPSSEHKNNNQFLTKIAYVSRNVEMSVNSDKPIKND